MRPPAHPHRVLLAVALTVLSAAPAAASNTLHVGPSQPFARIEAALAVAAPGDTVLVHPLDQGRAYERVALTIRTPDVHLVAAPGAENARASRIRLNGDSYDYSGVGAIPRAIVQFDPGSDASSIEGFDLSGARNQSHNAAGVRINQADHVRIRSCTIHDNDMGIMSNGDPSLASARDQRIEQCLISANGAPADPGQSHNLYLGGHSATVSACEIHSSTTGHNLKSRTHLIRIEYCWIHDSANREIDLVDAPDTESPASDAVVIGCIITKAPDMHGNRAVIHFGQDTSHARSGTLHLVNSTIITPYVSPVITLSSPDTRVSMTGCLLSDATSGQHNQTILACIGASPPDPAAPRMHASANAFAGDFSAPPGWGARITTPIRFADPSTGDFHVVSPPEALLVPGTSLAARSLPEFPDNAPAPLRHYAHPQSSLPRADANAPAIGAFPLGADATPK